MLTGPRTIFLLSLGLRRKLPINGESRLVKVRLYGMVKNNSAFVSYGICTYLWRLLSNLGSLVSDRQRP